ncbi:MAG: hypothetical protein EOP45_12255, partial [Sphingobacteriaceae bacterium]
MTGFTLSSCGGFDRNYIGSRLQPTSAVQTYYDLKDIKQEYKVIGHFVSQYPYLPSNQERVKAKLIEEAKKVGADALVFSEVNMKNTPSSTDYFIKADAIKYL